MPWSFANLDEILALVRDAVERGIFVPDPAVPMTIEPSRAIFEQVKATYGAGAIYIPYI